jgi:zinc protease
MPRAAKPRPPSLCDTITPMLSRLALALLLPVLAHAQLADPAVDRTTLPNGLDLLLHVDRRAPIVHVNIRILAGSKHEKPGQYGLAHLVEHLFYEDRDGNPISTELERLGATNSCGDLNEDFTEFCETIPSGRLERYLWMRSNEFALFFQNLTQKNLDIQREVVINERRQKLENEPGHLLNPILHEQLFPPGHPYHHDVIGLVEDLRAVNLDIVRAFFAEHYTPDQVAIAVVGDFDPAQVKEWIAKYFGALTPADVRTVPPVSAPPLTAPKFQQDSAHVQDERINFAFVGPSVSSRDSAALDFAERIWTNDYSPHHLHKVVTDKYSQASSINRIPLQDASVFAPYVDMVPGSPISAIEEKIVAEFARLAREGPTPAEMESTRNHLESGLLDDLESISGFASTIQQVHQFYGGIDHWHDWATRYSSITAADVRAAVNRWLVVPSHLTVDVRPQTAVRPGAPGPDRATPPPFQPEKPFHAPGVQTAKLPNGLQILVLERHDIPKVAVRLQFRVGALQSPADKSGVMLLAAAGIRGGGNREQDELMRTFDDLAASIGMDADLNSTDFHVEVLRKNLDPVLQLLADATQHPKYPDWATDGYKKDWIAEVEHPASNLDNFSRPFYAAAFGPNHPLGRGLGTVESLRSITTTDVRAFHDRFWKPDIAALVFAGDVTLKDAVALASAAFSDWTGAAPPVPPMPPPAPQHGRILYIDRPGVTQTKILQVLPGIPRDHPDYPALALANRIYGGMSDSRIWKNIRQQHGIAYYASSYMPTFPGAGLWIVESPIQQDSTLAGMREFEKELAAFGRTKPITQAELDQAKSVVIRALPEEFETIGSAAGSVAWNWAQGLRLNESEAFGDQIAALTLDQVNAVARKYARNDQAFFVLVGDRSKIEPQLREFR